jgi:hypothetical protein
MKTSELTGAALDWAVAKCEDVYCFDGSYIPSTNWAQGGPIIEREGISWHCGNKASWHAYGYGSADNISGPTPLIAAMRCYVASKLGDDVDIPEELTP